MYSKAQNVCIQREIRVFEVFSRKVTHTAISRETSIDTHARAHTHAEREIEREREREREGGRERERERERGTDTDIHTVHDTPTSFISG